EISGRAPNLDSGQRRQTDIFLQQHRSGFSITVRFEDTHAPAIGRKSRSAKPSAENARFVSGHDFSHAVELLKNVSGFSRWVESASLKSSFSLLRSKTSLALVVVT